MYTAAVIRPALPRDAAAIHALHMAAIRAIADVHYTPAHLQAWCGDRTPASYLPPIAERVMLVAQPGVETEADAEAEAGPELWGFGQLDMRARTVEAVYVLPAAQGSGIGRQLLQTLEWHAGAAGVTELRLDASMNGVPFYAAMGFEPVSSHEHPLGGALTLPCLRMRKALRAAKRAS